MARESTSRGKQEFLQDIANYEKLLQNANLEADIPPRRAMRAKSLKPVIKVKRAAKPTALSKKYLQKIKKSPYLARPTYNGKPQIKLMEPAAPARRQTRSVKKRQQFEESKPLQNKFELPERKKRSALWESVANVDSEKMSFDHSIMTTNTYESLIRTIREKAEDIDFGLLCKFLPKNLEAEKQRFHIDFEADQGHIYPRGRLFSDDIDYFFKQLSDSIPSNGTDTIPLI